MRTDGGPAAVSAVSSAIEALVPGADIRVQYLTNFTSFLTRRERSLAWLAGVFSAVAIMLAAIGLYGVMAFQVSARTSEIGIRIALGADRTRVVRMVLRQSILLVIAGVVLGIPLTLMASKALAALLYGVGAWNPAPILVAGLVLAAVGTLASLLPARRAARVDPLIAIRAD
jgi:ABC-type antimicrobial peptide transport system permease subunit